MRWVGSGRFAGEEHSPKSLGGVCNSSILADPRQSFQRAARFQAGGPEFNGAGGAIAPGESWSLRTGRLLTPEEIGRFFARDDKLLRQLILRRGDRPAFLQRAFYELIRGRFAHA